MNSASPLIRVDPELARLAIALRMFSGLRVWAAARAFATPAGWIHQNDLLEKLNQLNITSSPRTLRHWLAEGDGIFYHTDHHTGRIYPRAYANPRYPERGLAAMLTRLAIERGKSVLVDTNRPGARPVGIDLSGNARDAMARCYAVWVNGKTISRELLCKLWGRTARTLQAWEQIAGVEIRANFAQYGDKNDPCVPEHHYLCKSVCGRDFASWRLPNSYVLSDPEHLPKGRARKARKAANHLYDQTELPVEYMADGLEPFGRLYWDESQGKRGYRDPFQNRTAHLRKRGDGMPCYARLSTRARGVTVYEGGDADVPTTVHLIRDFEEERTPEFKAHRATWRMFRKTGGV